MAELRFRPPRMRLVRFYSRRWWGLRAHPARPPVVLVLGFTALIAVGSLALLLPISVHPGGHADPLTALFTSTSAVCVTGLVVVDTGPFWSPFGQAVILVLMQVGGLGFVIGATALALLLGCRVSIRQRVILEEIGSATSLGGSALIVEDWVGQSLAELRLSERGPLVVLAIQRGGEALAVPGVDERVREGDILALLEQDSRLGALPGRPRQRR